eukprot:TRINITY_DN63_c0_g1_i3.p2 TRINITY_DN63_c0_g1~~TRINITY_DN63_c0_g1_i3.p2  ORF type:complete len:411 (+),score=205.38 TRINITY_DN63_c0_g1_i3:73-1305(+)
MAAKRDTFGDQVPGCEPSWYQGQPSPYYHDGHRAFRAKCRAFVEKEIEPFQDKWIAEGYPKELHVKARQQGVMPRPKEIGGNDEWDPFYELIMADEFSRAGGAGVMGQSAINSMALPPILHHGSDYLKSLVVDDVAEGRKHISLAISEPNAGSDVGAVATKAIKKDGFYEVSGFKKWITGGLMADYFTTLVRTGKAGMFGLSLLLIPANTPGITIRKMETQFDNAHNTTFITFDKVKVPEKMLIGKENQAFRYIMYNFNHERWLIAVGGARSARVCYTEAFKYAMQRKTFGKKLIDHQIIRFKLAEMLRMIESVQDSCEAVAYAFKAGMKDHELGMQCALLKVNASKCFEYCAREASQIFGGSAIVKEGKGKIVERLYRVVRATAIPGGSEEVLLDFSMRFAAQKAKPHL